LPRPVKDAAPIAAHRLQQGQGGDRGGIGAHDARAQRDGGDESAPVQQRALGFAEPAFRADEQPERPGLQALQDGDGIGGARGLVAEDEPPRRVPAGNDLVERFGRQHVGNRDQIALFGGFDGVGPEALQIDPLRHGALGKDWPQAAHAHLGGLLGHVVEPGVLERRKQIVDVRRLAGLGRLVVAHGVSPALADGCKPAQPFAVAAVEQAQRIAGLEPHDVGHIVRLLAAQRHLSAAGQRGLGIKARDACERGHGGHS
jgi:hypothetical protein